MEAWEEVQRELRRQRDRLMRKANVAGCGVGMKERDGRVTDEPSVIVFVTRKQPLESLRRRDRVPTTLGTCKTDVVEVGELRALASRLRTSRMRPARPGISISHYRVSAGTFGAVVYDQASDEPLILSNNHVIANSTSASAVRAEVGDPIYQPGTFDGGHADDIIGHLLRFAPIHSESVSSGWKRWLRRLTGRPACRNLIDGAVARPISPAVIDPDILRIGPLQGSIEAQPGMHVRKSGRTSGLNEGVVRAIGATLDINMGEAGIVRFEDQIVTSPLAQPGDSGSAVVDSCNRFVGLLFAGSEMATICNRAEHVAEILKVRFKKRKDPKASSGLATDDSKTLRSRRRA